MTIEAYPLGLSTILTAQKSRKQAASFSLSEPRRGYAYVQETGTDTPVFWSVGFGFHQADAIRFRLWFETKINRGVDEFILPIKTEYGIVEHTCRFMPDGLMDTGQTGGIFTYSATIMARAMVTPDGYADAADIIVSTPDWMDYAYWLDFALVEGMPE